MKSRGVCSWTGIWSALFVASAHSWNGMTEVAVDEEIEVVG